MGMKEVGGVTFHVDHKLLSLWKRNSLSEVARLNIDKNYVVDGPERIGKSLWTIQQMAVLEPAIFESVEKFLSRVCFDWKDFNTACRTIRNGVIAFDEAFRGFSSRSALSKTNKQLIQTLMEMGQNNNIVFIVLPSFFLLDIYPAMLRSDGLFHIRQDKKTRLRAFSGYGREDKNKIYQQGIRNGWGYHIRTQFIGRFSNKFPGGEKFRKAYETKKRKSMEDITKNIMPEETESKYMIQRNLLLQKKWEELKSLRKTAEWSTSAGVTLSYARLSEIGIGKKKVKQEKAVQS